MTVFRSRPICLSFGLLALGACQHPAAPEPAAGRVSVRTVETPADPPAAKGRAVELVPLTLGDTRVSLIEAYPRGDLPNPIYPPAALAAHAGWVVLGVRITIDQTGKVSDVQPSPMGVSSAGPYSELFMAAVRTAAQSWRFSPARLKTETVVRTEAGSLEWAYTTSKPTESFTDLSVDFSEKVGLNWNSPKAPGR